MKLGGIDQDSGHSGLWIDPTYRVSDLIPTSAVNLNPAEEVHSELYPGGGPNKVFSGIDPAPPGDRFIALGSFSVDVRSFKGSVDRSNIVPSAGCRYVVNAGMVMSKGYPTSFCSCHIVDLLEATILTGHSLGNNFDGEDITRTVINDSVRSFRLAFLPVEMKRGPGIPLILQGHGIHHVWHSYPDSRDRDLSI